MSAAMSELSRRTDERDDALRQVARISAERGIANFLLSGLVRECLSELIVEGYGGKPGFTVPVGTPLRTECEHLAEYGLVERDGDRFWWPDE